MTSKIRVGIIGSGGWARYGHIPALQALEGFDIVALAGRDLPRCRGMRTSSTLHVRSAVPRS